MAKIITFLLALTIIYLNVTAQTNTDPCSLPEASQMDFWIGEWTLEWTNADGTIGRGTNNITKILGGCTVQENFINDDNTFQGMSISVYNANKKMWEQTWVDNAGMYMPFTGEFKDGKMTLGREIINKEGKKVLARMVFHNISYNNFDWNWESSKDEGATWQLMWKIHYTRKNK